MQVKFLNGWTNKASKVTKDDNNTWSSEGPPIWFYYNQLEIKLSSVINSLLALQSPVAAHTYFRIIDSFVVRLTMVK
jgi:hypothetical protein